MMGMATNMSGPVPMGAFATGPGFSDMDMRPRRRPSLTPMIDVVFLLLVFFMLAARFGPDQVTDLSAAGGSAAYQGAPRLVDIREDGLTLNGVPTDIRALPDALSRVADGPGAAIVLRGRSRATVQHIVDVATRLRQAGYTNLVLVE